MRNTEQSEARKFYDMSKWSEAKKNMEKLDRAQKCSILGPQNLRSGSLGPWGSLDLHLQIEWDLIS